jgi:hypothetical protein
VGALLETCVRNGSYDEALELEAFAARLAAGAQGVALASALAEDARRGVRAMLSQLLARLRGPVQLPECLRCVGYLRRLGVFAEPELRLAFVRSRDAWLRAALAELDAAAPPPAEAAKRLTDTHRVHLFDGVMQYRAIFADDSSAADACAPGAGADGGGGAPGGSLVHGWALARVGAYLEALAALLPRLSEGAVVASVLEHAAYCGASLGRVGLDFRPLLPPMFTAALAALAQRALAGAAEGFERALAAQRWAQGGAASLPPPPQQQQQAEEEAGAPPLALMAAPPVAALVNGVLAALNELRHCALPALRSPLAAALHACLAAAAQALARHAAAQTAPLGEAHAAQLAALCGALAHTAAPYAAACFGRVFPGGAPLVDAPGAVAPAKQLLTQLAPRLPAAAPAPGAAPAPAAPAPPTPQPPAAMPAAPPA